MPAGRRCSPLRAWPVFSTNVLYRPELARNRGPCPGPLTVSIIRLLAKDRPVRPNRLIMYWQPGYWQPGYWQPGAAWREPFRGFR